MELLPTDFGDAGQNEDLRMVKVAPSEIVMEDSASSDGATTH